MKTVWLALGSNLGDRRARLRQALEKLDSPDLRLIRASSLYETAPMGLTDQPWFLNQVAEFETALLPLRLLHRIHRIENELGRVRTVVNGPRTVDIDIILYGNAIVRTAELEIPHPRYRERRFVLEPLAELNPTLRDPATREPITAMLDAVRSQTVRPLNDNS
ncbi:MAG TPA: 2-amino-4-hydroxy-6-hydroxymethyldihydropteridine diphosphokinase [Bryobacteraceae bacterium]|nr:2-amino-4-hydroxy-6-hydroxymethyldihydropteridine diphosphokinase [Bryobacteraceae bacterium]